MTVWWFAWGVFPSQHPFYFSCFPLLVQSSLTTSRSPISSAEWPLTCSQTLSINFHICHAHLWLHHRFPFIYYYWFALTNYGWDYWQDLAIASVQVSFVAGSLIIAIFFDVQAATPPLKIFSKASSLSFDCLRLSMVFVFLVCTEFFRLSRYYSLVSIMISGWKRLSS
jgi:hypothetical protein